MCHADAGGCKLYHTKAGVTPVEFRGMVQAVFLWRARDAAGLDMQTELYPYWAEQALMLGNAVINQVERERMESDGDEQGGSSDLQIKSKGDSGAFSAIYEFMQERNIKPKRD